MNQKLKETLLELLSISSIHGLPNLIRSKRLFHKIMWAIAFTIFLVILCCSIIECITAYLEYKVITEIQTIFEQPAPFPTISFCSKDEYFFNNKTLNDLFKQNRLQCVFNYDESCLSEPNEHFEAFYSSNFGKCFRFNSGRNMRGDSIPILNSSIGGRDDSFRLQIHAPAGLGKLDVFLFMIKFVYFN